MLFSLPALLDTHKRSSTPEPFVTPAVSKQQAKKTTRLASGLRQRESLLNLSLPRDHRAGPPPSPDPFLQEVFQLYRDQHSYNDPANTAELEQIYKNSQSPFPAQVD
ncbi:unnamed protein product [Lepidochelys kempii]